MLVLEMPFRMLDFDHYVDLLFNGLKFIEGINFPYRKKLYSNNANHGCIIINVSKVLNGDVQFLHASRGVDTLPKGKCDFIEWDASQILNQIESPLRQDEMNDIIVGNSSNGDENILHESRI